MKTLAEARKALKQLSGQWDYYDDLELVSYDDYVKFKLTLCESLPEYEVYYQRQNSVVSIWERGRVDYNHHGKPYQIRIASHWEVNYQLFYRYETIVIPQYNEQEKRVVQLWVINHETELLKYQELYNGKAITLLTR